MHYIDSHNLQLVSTNQQLCLYLEVVYTFAMLPHSYVRGRGLDPQQLTLKTSSWLFMFLLCFLFDILMECMYCCLGF